MTLPFLRRIFFKLCLYSALFPASTAFAQQFDGQWIKHTDTLGAFSVKVPSKPTAMSRMAPSEREGIDSLQIHILFSSDEEEEKNYIFQYYDYPKGMYLADWKLALNAMVDKFRKGDKGELVGEPKLIQKQGNVGYQMGVISQGYYMEMQVFIRGNRIYLFMVQNTAGEEQPEPDEFFNSIRFETYGTSPLVPFSIGVAKLQLPAEAKMIVDEQNPSSATVRSTSYYTANPNSGGVYGTETGTFNKFVKYANIDSLYQLLLKELNSGKDSMIQLVDHSVGQVKGKMYAAKDTVAGTEIKALCWIDGNQYYLLYARVAAEELKSTALENFFKVNYTSVKSKFVLQASKAQLIMDELQQSDTTSKKAAFAALDYYKFEKNELPIVYRTLRSSFADDTVSTGVRTNLLAVLSNVNDKTTVPFLQELYQSKLPDLIKSGVLSTVPKIDSTQYDWYLKKLLEAPPLKLKYYWTLFDPLSDSLAYFANHFEKLLPLFDEPNYRPILLNLTNNLRSEKAKSQYNPLILKHKGKITEKAIADIDQYIADKSQSPTAVYPYLNLLPILDLPKLTDEFSNKVFKLDSVPYLHTLAMVARIKTGLSLNQQQLGAMLDSLSSRYELIQAYEEMNRLSEVPAKYKKHDEFAKLLVYRELENDDAFAEAINLLGKVTGKNGSYYAFEVVFEEEGVKKKYLAFVGAFDDKQQTLKLDSYETFMEWEEVQEDWLAQVKAVIATLDEK